MSETKMRLWAFDFSGDRQVDIAAISFKDAMSYLVDCDYFIDWDEDDGTVEWRLRKDDESLAVRLEDEPDAADLALPGVSWDPVKKVMTAPASSWAASCSETTCVGDTES